MIATLTIGKRRAGRPSASGSMPRHLLRFAHERRSRRRPAGRGYETASLALTAADANALLTQELPDPDVVPAHRRQGHVAAAATQHDLAAPAMTTQDRLVDLGVRNLEHPPTEQH